MIKIFPASAKKFNTNGLKVIFPNSCTEYKKKSLNGWYIETEINIKYKEYIVKDNIIAVKTKSKIMPQGFRIEKIEERTSTIFVTANHVMFDAENYYLDDVRPTNLSAANALNYINERTDVDSPFSFSSNITTIATQYIVDKSLLEAMSLVEERWNGFFDADNFAISFKSKLGNNNGEIIRQKKNLVSRVISEDWSNVVTKLFPKGPDDLTLPEKFLESDVKYNVPYTRHEKFDFDTEELNDTEKVSKLRELSTQYLEENKYPQVCYELEANLQNVEIGDQVQVIDNSINILTEIQEYIYDLNTKKIKNIVFGNYTKNVREKFNNIRTTIFDVINTLSKQQLMIQNQTDLINNLNKNGIVKITDNEILILDKLPLEEAQNVWRFGLGGLAFSKNGYEGPFETAITIDGKINANFIMAGKMSTERIEGFEQLLLTVSNIQNFKEEKSANNKLIIDNAQEGSLLGLSITGEMELLYPADDLYPNDDLYPLDSYLNIENSDGEIRQVLLPITHLYKVDDISDEFVLERIYNESTKKYESKCKIIRRITVDSSGNKSIAASETIENNGTLDIELWKGTNKIYLESFKNMNYTCKYTIINEITDEYATHKELETSILITEDKILQSAKLKVDNTTFETYQELTAQEFNVRVKSNEVIAAINLSSEAATISANRINLKANDILNLLANNTINMTARNIIISSTKANIDADGNAKFMNAEIKGKIEASSGKIGGAEINDVGLYFNNGNTGWGLWGTTMHAGIVMHAGANGSNIGGAPFRLYHDGSFVATKATINGTISSSTINGSTINGSHITGGSIKIESTGFFTFGTGTTHPWMSAANVCGLYGINFYNGTTSSSTGTQQGYIDMGGSNGALQVVSISTDVVLGGYHVKLNPRSGGTAYVVTSSGGTYAISTAGGNLSSLNLKEDLLKFDENEYQKAYDLLKKIDLYRFNYKYKISKNKNEYGFIIDYIEENQDYDKFLYFKNEHAKVLKNKEFDFSASEDDNNVINFKQYDQENLLKFVLASLKSIQYELEKIKEVIV